MLVSVSIALLVIVSIALLVSGCCSASKSQCCSASKWQYIHMFLCSVNTVLLSNLYAIPQYEYEMLVQDIARCFSLLWRTCLDVVSSTVGTRYLSTSKS